LVKRIRNRGRQHSTEIVALDGGTRSEVGRADRLPDALGAIATTATTWVENRYTPRS
jgi:hypothetical protein